MRLLKLQIVRWISSALNSFYKLTGSEKVFFYPLTKEFTDNPYPIYDRLRSSAPVYKSPLGFWVVTRSKDVNFVLKDPGFGNDYKRKTIERHGPNALDDPSIHMMSMWLLVLHPPDHTRIRSLMTKTFSARLVKKMRPQFEASVNKLIDKVIDKGEMDIIRDLAKPLPVMVICEILGIPEKDWQWFIYEANLPGRLIDPMPMTAQERDEINQRVLELNAYFEKFIDLKREQPADDLGTLMVQAFDEGEDKLSKAELISSFELLFGAGHDTTMNLIGNGLNALLNHPEQFNKLRQKPELISNAIEELLRYDAPVQLAHRMAMQDTEIDGHSIKEGEIIITALGAANRDPELYTDPNSLDIEREKIKHSAFGGGIHFCIGAMLARIETEIAFKVLLERIPDFQLSSKQQEWNPTATLRGLRSLPVTWEQ